MSLLSSKQKIEILNYCGTSIKQKYWTIIKFMAFYPGIFFFIAPIKMIKSIAFPVQSDFFKGTL